MFKIFRRNAANIPDLERLVASHKELKKQVDWLEDEFRQLNGKHHKLSGRFYSRFGTGEVPTQPSEAVTMSRDELRKLAGITAGRPAPHK